MKAKYLLIGLFLVLTQAAFAQQETLTNKTVIDLVKSGLDKDIIIDKIGSSMSRFDVSTTGLIALKKDGVPSEVIKAMMNKSSGKAPVVKPVTTTNTEPAIHTTSRHMPQLDVVNVPWFYDSRNNTTKALEKITGDIKGKITAKAVLSPFGGSSDIYFRLDGDKSPVRLSGTDSITFVINPDKGTPDAFTLYKMDTKKGKRETIYEPDAGSKKQKGAIAFHYMKLSDSLYKLFADTKLAPGEYCLLFEYSVATYDGKKGDAYAFGID